MIHGGDVYSEGILKGRELLDYSSNINPLGVPKSFKDNIDKALEALVRYPDIQYRELREKLQEYLNVDKRNFILGNGAAEVIDAAVSLVSKIVIVAPAFAEYELNAKKWGVEIAYSYLKEEKYCDDKLYSFNYDYEDIFNKLQQADGIIIGNPNNPNGGIIEKEKFQSILDYCDKEGKYVIIDEAFIEFTGDKDNSFIDDISQHKSLIIIRALTKFFGMPGIRFGYAVTSNERAKALMEEKINPWNVNSFAELAAKTVLFDKDYINKTLKWIEEERVYFRNELENITFIEKVYLSKANYVLCKLEAMSAEELYDKCMEKNIVIRKADNYRGLSERYVRFAVKDREKNEHFIDVLKTINKEIN